MTIISALSEQCIRETAVRFSFYKVLSLFTAEYIVIQLPDVN